MILDEDAVTADHTPDGGWYCTCPEAEGAHVHCPWGGSHIHLVDPETGRDREHPRTERSGE